MPEDKIMGAAISFEVGQMQGLRNLVATPIEMGQQCPCTPRGEGKGWLGDELLTFTLPQAGSCRPTARPLCQEMQIPQVKARVAFPVVTFQSFVH